MTRVRFCGALFVLATAACGTTVPGAAVYSSTQSGLGAGSSTAISGGSSGSTGGFAQTPGLSQQGTGQSQSTTGSSTGSTSTQTQNTQGPGVTTTGPNQGGPIQPGKGKPIVIGVITSGNTGAYASAIGVNANFGDQRKQSQAVADYLNAHGGVQGHPIKLTFYDYNTNSGAPGNASAACAAFTQDQHAFAAIGVAGMDDSYFSCAAKAGMFVLTDAGANGSSFYRKFPTTVLISDANLTRRYSAMTYALHNEGFFTPGAKIAILRTESAGDVEGVRDGMKPALAKLGLKVKDEVGLNDTNASAYYSGLNGAVLRFKTDGITHVLFGHASALFFMNSAQSQGYTPMIGLDSAQSPAQVLQPQAAAIGGQLANTWGFGYNPLLDVDATRDPGPVSERQKLCDAILKAAGQGSGTNRTSETLALVLCDELFFLNDVLNRQPDASQLSFLNGVAGLAGGYRSTLTFSTYFSPDRHDGADGFRPFRYKTSCKCFTYTAGVRPFPTQ